VLITVPRKAAILRNVVFITTLLISISIQASDIDLIRQSEKLSRGAGGGGDSVEVIQQAGLMPPLFFNFQKDDRTRNKTEYQTEFCQSAREGLERLSDILKNQDCLASKLSTLCSSAELFEIDPSLPITAMNWPKTNHVALNAGRWDMLSKIFKPDTRSAIYRAIGAHEILSLCQLETTHAYDLSSTILTNTLFSNLRTQNDLEKAVGISVLNSEFKNAESMLDLRENISKLINQNRTTGLFGGLVFNHLRDQLASFSPVFDDKISSTLDVNYKLEYREKVFARGNEYVIGRNNDLLNPIVHQLIEYLSSLGLKIDANKDTKPSWALAVQLHQLIVAIIDPPFEIKYITSIRGNYWKTGMLKQLNGYSVIIAEKNWASFFKSSFKIDPNNKSISVLFDSQLDDSIEDLPDNYTYYLTGHQEDSVYFIQNFPVFYLGQNSGRYRLMQTSGNFVYFPKNPAYVESFMVTSTVFPAEFMSHSSGITTATHIQNTFRDYSEFKSILKNQNNKE
jgi:hypothetical protein